VTQAPVPPARAGDQPVRALGPSSLSAVISVDEQGMIVAWSAAAEQLFGWSAAEVVGRRLSETIIPPGYRVAHEAGLRRFRETGSAVTAGRVLEASALRIDGSEFPVELSISPPVPADDGHHVFTAFVRDLSERHRLEQVHRMQFQVTRLLAEAATLDDAAPLVLAVIGENLGWDVGILWVVDSDGGNLRFNALWSRPGLDVEEFAARSRVLSLPLTSPCQDRCGAAARRSTSPTSASSPTPARHTPAAPDCAAPSASPSPALTASSVSSSSSAARCSRPTRWCSAPCRTWAGSSASSSSTASPSSCCGCASTSWRCCSAPPTH
jgi:PAS domain S-box-containing protein